MNCDLQTKTRSYIGNSPLYGESFINAVLKLKLRNSAGKCIQREEIHKLENIIFYLLTKNQPLGKPFSSKGALREIVRLESNVFSVQTEKLLGKGQYKRAYEGMLVTINKNGMMLAAEEVVNVAILKVFRDIDSARLEDAAAAKFDSPHIVKKSLFNYAPLRGSWAMVNEKFAYDLQKVIFKSVRLSFKNKVSKLMDAAKGLAYLHSLKFVHRDIKPENIAVGQDGRAVLIDLGFLEEEGVLAKVVGSPLYLAPEVKLEENQNLESDWGKANVSTAMDLWAFGLTCFEVCHPTNALPPFFKKVATITDLAVVHSQLLSLEDRTKYNSSLFKNWNSLDKNEISFQGVITELLSPQAENRGNSVNLSQNLEKIVSQMDGIV